LLGLIRGYDYGEFDGMKIGRGNRSTRGKPATHNTVITPRIKTDIPFWILGKVDEFHSLPAGRQAPSITATFRFHVFTARSNTKIITPSRYP
jgi:hypothetical protein